MKGGSKLGRALCRARDLYVRTMTGLAGRASRRGVGVYTGRAAAGAPGSHCFRSPRGSSGEDDLRELVVAASRGAAGPAGGGKGGSQSMVTIGRIDEDQPCDFGEAKSRR